MSGSTNDYDPKTGMRLDASGRPIRGMRALLNKLAADLAKIDNHEDNTGARCRVDLLGHDCCYVCNALEDVAAVYAGYMEEA